MNRKIYYKDNYISFENPSAQSPGNQAIIKFDAIKNEKDCQVLLRYLLSEGPPKIIYLPEQEFDRTFNLLKEELHYIEAAGGLIEKNGEYLCIHRLGRWDLPKGKLEKKESPENAAIRECEEECGVRDLTIIKPLRSTFHIYPYKKGHAIKQSYWYYMKTSYDKALVAQTEENIDQVKWCTLQEVKDVILKDTYYTVSDVINEGLSV